MRIIVYGLGKEFEKYKQYIEKHYTVVGYCDRKNIDIDNYFLPNQLKEIDFDAIYISSMKYIEQIKSDIIKICERSDIVFLCEEDLFGKKLNPQMREQWIINKLKSVEKGKVLLDAGAGEMIYAPYCRHLRYIAQDFGKYDPNELKEGLQLKEWNYSNDLILCDIVDMPFENESIDVILCTEVFEHIADPLKALNEFCRILKKGGRLILTAPYSSLVHMAPYFYTSGFSKYWYINHFESLGLEIKEITSYGNYFTWLNQEIKRLPEIVNKYSNDSISERDINIMNEMCILLNRYDSHGNNSDELLCFGYMVDAEKK